MAKPPTSRSAFATLAERAGLSLSERQLDEMHEVYPRLEAMAQRVRGAGARAVAAEPALIFKPSGKMS
jgi:hypothetical protein